MTEASPDRRGVTLRSVLIGVIATAFLGWIAPYAAHVLHASYLALDFSTPGATALLFLIIALYNPVMGRLRRSWALAPAELVVVYAMLILGSAVVEMGLASQLLPIVATPAYYQTPENRWQELYIDRLPPGVVLRDLDAAKRFFEGAPRAAIDWHAWLPTLLVWAPMLIALYAVMVALMVIFRRQWDERERLAYPLTQVPLAMVDRQQPLLRNPIMWVGFAIPFLFASLKGLHFYFPAVPSFRENYSVPVFGQYGSLIIRLSFPMLGFFFLVNMDAAFSLWFFNLLFWLAKSMMLRVGFEFSVNLGTYGTPFALYKFIGWGAIIALAIGTFYSARNHLGDVLGKALGTRRDVKDDDEAMSYRAAVLTTVIGFGVMVSWLMWTGLPIWIAVFFLLMALVLFLALTRIVVETGLAEAVAPIIAPDSVVAAMGNSVLGPKGHAGLALTYVYSSDIRTYVMASAASALKLFHNVGLRGRSLFWVMSLGVAVGVGSSLWATLAMAYRYGGATMSSWFFVRGPQLPFDWLAQLMQVPAEVEPFGITMAVVGGVVMAGLMFARQTFWWWPLHPVGWAIGSVWIMDQLWFTCMLAWAAKFAVIRGGGLKLYRTVRPAAIGLILGQFTANFVWVVIDHFAGGIGNAIFWI